MARRKEVTGETVSFDLPSGIPVEIQEIGGHAEKVLRNKEFLKTGKAIDLFMMDAIVRLNGEPLPESEFEAEKLLMDMKSGDRGYLLLRIRMQSYGEEMIFNHKCPVCKKTSGYQVNFQELLDDGTLKIHPYREDVPILLETRGGTAEINYLTGRKERLLASQSEIDPITLAMLACDTFNGQKPTYAVFEKLFAKDLSAIRTTLFDLKGGLDPRIELDCLKCDNSYPVSIEKIPDFFLPSTTRREISGR